MNEQDESKLAARLQESLTPMSRELNRDLWPQILRRMDVDQSAPGRPWVLVLLSPAALSSVPWFDWALLAVLVVGVCIFPRSIPIWLYHF